MGLAMVQQEKFRVLSGGDGRSIRPRKTLLARFRRDRRGSVAVEYAILALPFFLLVFAIIETGVRFTAQQLLANTTDTIARQFRTGQLVAEELAAGQVRGIICKKIEIIVATGCPDLFVDLQHYDRFSDVPTTLPLKADGDVNDSGFKIDPGSKLTINQLRVFYRWPLMTDVMRGRLSSMPNGKTLLYSTVTWQNEPY